MESKLRIICGPIILEHLFLESSSWICYCHTQCFLSYHTCQIDWLAELKLAALLHSYLVFKTADSYDLFYSSYVISKSTYGTVDILFGEKWCVCSGN